MTTNALLAPPVTVSRVPVTAVTPTTLTTVPPDTTPLHVALLPGVPARVAARLPARAVLVDLDDPRLEVAVVAGADPEQVRAVRARSPYASVLALVPADTDVPAVVHLLDAGAEACVREGDAREVTAHLLALERRRALTRR